MTRTPTMYRDFRARRSTDFAARLIVELGSRVVSETELPQVMSVPDIHAHVTAAMFRKYPGQYRIVGVYLARGTARVTLLPVARGGE